MTKGSNDNLGASRALLRKILFIVVRTLRAISFGATFCLSLIFFCSPLILRNEIIILIISFILTFILLFIPFPIPRDEPSKSRVSVFVVSTLYSILPSSAFLLVFYFLGKSEQYDHLVLDNFLLLLAPAVFFLFLFSSPYFRSIRYEQGPNRWICRTFIHPLLVSVASYPHIPTVFFPGV